ncbi:hypothetical protein B0I37DRAFT_433353 [Chaetomium sp. MPI-CAGE-AT-0009]|nr:hypothetical protein B0I37DRAFT_433353 [Chaetomium sp. MPI-CAGE-AT-0009]
MHLPEPTSIKCQTLTPDSNAGLGPLPPVVTIWQGLMRGTALASVKRSCFRCKKLGKQSQRAAQPLHARGCGHKGSLTRSFEDKNPLNSNGGLKLSLFSGGYHLCPLKVHASAAAPRRFLGCYLRRCYLRRRRYRPLGLPGRGDLNSGLEHVGFALGDVKDATESSAVAQGHKEPENSTRPNGQSAKGKGKEKRSVPEGDQAAPRTPAITLVKFITHTAENLDAVKVSRALQVLKRPQDSYNATV